MIEIISAVQRLYYRLTVGQKDIFVIRSFPEGMVFISSGCVLHIFPSAENKNCFLYVLSRVESLPPQQLSPNIQLMRNTVIRFVCLDKLQHLSETITNVCIASSSVPAGQADRHKGLLPPTAYYSWVQRPPVYGHGNVPLPLPATSKHSELTYGASELGGM